MADDSQGSGPARPEPGRATAEERRQERLAQALRANLKRRKDQLRGRLATDLPESDRVHEAPAGPGASED